MQSIKELFKEFYRIILILFLFLFIIILLGILGNLDSNNSLRIKFLDIGQGDSAIIISPSGQKTLIDTGPNFIVTQKVDNILSIVSQNIDNILLTHPDLDHVGGVKEIKVNNTVKNLIVSTENSYENYDFNNIFRINNKYDIDLGGIKLEILSPSIGELGDTNHNSIVSQIKYGNFRFVFMGDADTEIERKLVSQGVFDNYEGVTVLKVGHHGSKTASSEIFLKKLKPKYCVISVGKDNRYSHPNTEVLDRLEKYCGGIYRTDQDGGVFMETNGRLLEILKDK